MLTWIKEIALRDVVANEIDNEDFHMGLECVLSPEIQEFLALQNKMSRRINTKNTHEKRKLVLDEHELALG